MNKLALATSVQLAQNQRGPVAKLAASVLRTVPGIGTFIDPEKMRTALVGAGFKIVEYKPGDTPPSRREPLKHLSQVEVRKGDAIVAMGMSGDVDDALMQAVIAWMKEEAAT